MQIGEYDVTAFTPIYYSSCLFSSEIVT